MSTALVHLFPPKHHARALGIIDQVLSQDPANVPCLLARGYVSRYAGKYEDAQIVFSKVAGLVDATSTEGLLLQLEAKEEAAWCNSRLGRYVEAEVALREVIGALDGLELQENELESRKAKAWWRMGKTLWDRNGEFAPHALAILVDPFYFRKQLARRGIHTFHYRFEARLEFRSCIRISGHLLFRVRQSP